MSSRENQESTGSDSSNDESQATNETGQPTKDNAEQEATRLNTKVDIRGTHAGKGAKEAPDRLRDGT
jgi:hypothetical protein